MKTIITILCVLGSAVCALAAEAPTTQPNVVSQLATSAAAELARTNQELAHLERQIERQKTPMAEQLTQLEDRLTELRKEHGVIARTVVSGELELATIKAQMKLRQDEMSYIGNLMDEYARTYEAKVHVCELQNLGGAIEAAKQAPANTTLSMAQKFSRQSDFVNISIQRLFSAIGGMRFDGVAVDLKSNVLKGQFAIVGPVALFRSITGAEAGLAVPQTGSPNPLIRPLEGVMQDGLAALVATGDGMLPLDPSRGAALKALVQKTNLIHIFLKGGPIMWPLLLASILSLGTVLERLLFLLFNKLRRDPKAMQAFFTAVGAGKMDEAMRLGEKSKFYVVRALGYALRHREESLANALLFAQAKELRRFRRGIPILDTVITLAPLLGLLGTVTGMMSSFSLIGGELSAPGAITGGIAEALIATAFGLGIAITSVIPFNALNARADEARLEMEAAGTQLELLVPPSMRKAPAQNKSADAAPGHYVHHQPASLAPSVKE